MDRNINLLGQREELKNEPQKKIVVKLKGERSTRLHGGAQISASSMQTNEAIAKVLMSPPQGLAAQ